MPAATVTAAFAAARARAAGEGLFRWLAFALACAAVAGFARSYYLKGLFATRALPLAVHVHALLMSVWLVVFIAQTWLIAARKVQWHRRLGVAAAVLAVLIIGLGAWLTVKRVALEALLFTHASLAQFLALYGCCAACVAADTFWHRRLQPVLALGALSIIVAFQLSYFAVQTHTWLAIVARLFGA